jgi:hypothetical protein
MAILPMKVFNLSQKSLSVPLPNVAGEGHNKQYPSAAASPRELKTEKRATKGSEDEVFDSLPSGRTGGDKFSRALS